MLAPWVLIAFALTGYADAASDAVTLEDGSVVLGQVKDSTPRGGLVVLVRRDWARTNLPTRLGAWERAEAPLVRVARRERKERLIDWKQARAGGGDRLVPAIDREISRLSTLRPPRTVLMSVTLTRNEIRRVERRDEPTARLFRLGWIAGLGGVETMSVEGLKEALSFRGRLNLDDAASVDHLLPLYPETLERWNARRAATEVVAEPGLRFVNFRQFFLPETGPGSDAMPRTTTELIDSPAGRLAFGAIQAVTPFDARQERLDGLAERGRIGAIVSRLEFNVDSDRADAESVFWVRSGGGWSPILSQKASARTDESEDEVGVAPATESTPLRTALLVLESVAATPSAPGVSRRRQAVGATAERALGRARAALDRDLAPLILPVLSGLR